MVEFLRYALCFGINSILSTINEFERYNSPLRFGPDYGNQKGFIVKKLAEIESST